MGAVLFELYGIRALPVGQEIVSGYSDFPDICKGMGFAMDVYFTPDDAQRGYYNFPSKKQMAKMMTLEGCWQGECAAEDSDEGKGLLNFWVEGEYLQGELISNGITYKGLGIKCFGNYFRLLAFDPKTQKLVGSFDFEWLNKHCIVGICEQQGSRRPAVFTRVIVE